MATTSDTAAQTARGNGVNKLFTSKDLTPAQRRLRWVIIGIWVILAYGAVCVLVGSAPWTIWRLYGGPGRCVCRWAAARPRAVRAASFARRVSSKPGQAPPPPTGTAARSPAFRSLRCRGPGPAVPLVPSTPVAVGVLQH